VGEKDENSAGRKSAMYLQRNSVARSRNHFATTHSVRVFVELHVSVSVNCTKIFSAS
jgi:hypothetical protein